MSNATRRRATDVLSLIKSTFPVLRGFHQAKLSLRHVAWRVELVRQAARRGRWLSAISRCTIGVLPKRTGSNGLRSCPARSGASASRRLAGHGAHRPALAKPCGAGRAGRASRISGMTGLPMIPPVVATTEQTEARP